MKIERGEERHSFILEINAEEYAALAAAVRQTIETVEDLTQEQFLDSSWQQLLKVDKDLQDFIFEKSQ